MKSAALLVAWLAVAMAPAHSAKLPFDPLAGHSKNPAMACTKFSQRESKNNGMDVDNDCSENVNILIAVYDKHDHYLLNMWHHTQPGSDAITGIPEYEDDDEFYVHPDRHGFTEYHIACFETDRKCNRKIDCVRAQGHDDGGILSVADVVATAEDCKVDLSGVKSE